MHSKESLCLAKLSCKGTPHCNLRPTLFCLFVWFFLAVFLSPRGHSSCCNFFAIFGNFNTTEKVVCFLLTPELYIYIFKWLFLITLSQPPKKDMTLLTSELYKNGITHHNAFCNCLFPHSIVFGNWVLLLFLTADQSFPLRLFHRARTEQMGMCFYQRTFTVFPLLASVSNAAVNIIKCLLAHLHRIYLKYARTSKITGCP